MGYVAIYMVYLFLITIKLGGSQGIFRENLDTTVESARITLPQFTEAKTG
jgi:hypothetical protein